MEHSFWLERWQRNEIGFHQNEINTHLQAFWSRLGMQAGDTIFVPLCGKSRDMLWLAAQRHRVLGVEISALAVEAFFAENGLAPERIKSGPFESWQCDEVKLLCGDFFTLTPAMLRGVQGVYDRASLIALPPPMREQYARHLAQLLVPGSRVLLITMEYPPHQMQGPPFCVLEDEVRRLYDAAFEVTQIHAENMLDRNPRFRERGLTDLRERVYVLVRRGGG